MVEEAVLLVDRGDHSQQLHPVPVPLTCTSNTPSVPMTGDWKSCCPFALFSTSSFTSWSSTKTTPHRRRWWVGSLEREESLSKEDNISTGLHCLQWQKHKETPDTLLLQNMPNSPSTMYHTLFREVSYPTELQITHVLTINHPAPQSPRT